MLWGSPQNRAGLEDGDLEALQKDHSQADLSFIVCVHVCVHACVYTHACAYRCMFASHA